MSENQSPTSASNSRDSNLPGSAEGSTAAVPDRGLGQIPGDRPESQISLPLGGDDAGPDADPWVTVDLPGTLNIDGLADDAVLASPVSAADETPEPDTSAAPLAAERERELLALIHDLNECNDALLSRVSQLENALEQSQVAFKTESEKAQFAQNRLTEQVSVEQAAAQQAAQNAQQQVAKLVSELDTAEQALQRQQLIGENLQTELNNSQERVIQLERECASIAQQHAEEAQARVTAENTSRDLRSRLQRQQRYTLQFKAALEKSLTVSARSSSQPSSQPNVPAVTQPVSFKETAAVTMPKAQRIMPWASGASSAFEGIDPHLEALIRGAGKTGQPEEIPPTASGAAESAASLETAAPEAEAELWQDIERVMNGETDVPAETDAAETGAANASSDEHGPSPAGEPTVQTTATESTRESDEKSAAKPTSASADGSSPKLNWQAEAKTIRTAAPLAPAPQERVERSAAEIAREKVAAAEVTYTEPSPWSAQPLPQQAAPSPAAQANQSADCIPSMAAKTAGSAVSPIVKPLRPQKKIGSLAAVQLPTFGNAKSGSFKRSSG